MRPDTKIDAPCSGVNTYQEYLQTAHWKRLKEACYLQYGYNCLLCSSRRNLHVHHTVYRKSWFDTLPEDLCPLCDTCHKSVHRRGYQGLSPDALKQKYRKKVSSNMHSRAYYHAKFKALSKISYQRPSVHRIEPKKARKK